MSSYVHMKAIRYKFDKEKADDLIRSEAIWAWNPFKDNSKFEYNIGLDFNSGEEEVYLDKVYLKEYDEVSGDFTKSRRLSDKEIECHLKDFKEYDKNIQADDLRAVELCYYNSVDAPACYDEIIDEEWLF